MTTLPEEANNYIFTGTGRAGSGVVAAVTGFLADRDCYICALEQFDDESTDKFFMRAVFRPQENSPSIDEIKACFGEISDAFDMDWKIHDPQVPVKTVIMVSKYDHCLDDILYRRRKGEFNMEIAAVVSNHLDLRPMVEREGFALFTCRLPRTAKRNRNSDCWKLLRKPRANW